MNPINNSFNLENFPIEIQCSILQNCSQKNLNQIALVSKHFHTLSRESNFKDSRNFTIGNNVCLKKERKFTYQFSTGVNYIPSKALFFYISPCGLKFKTYQIKDMIQKYPIHRKLFENNFEMKTDLNGKNYLDYKFEDVNFSQLTEANHLEHVKFTTRYLNIQSKIKSNIGFFEQHTSCFITSTANSSELFVKKTLSNEGVEYCFEGRYDCVKENYTNHLSNRQLTIRQNDEFLRTFSIESGFIESFEILHSFIFILVAGEIQIFNKTTLNHVRTIVPKLRYLAMHIDEKKGVLYALTSLGMEVHDFSQYQNPISHNQQKSTFLKTISTITSFIHMFFKNILIVSTNPSQFFRNIPLEVVVVGGLIFTGTIIVSPSLQRVIMTTTLLFLAKVLYKSYLEF